MFLIFLPMARYFEQQNTCRNRCIQRIAASTHGNANHEVGSLEQLIRKSMSFTADYKSGGKSVGECFVSHKSGRRRSNNRYSV